MTIYAFDFFAGCGGASLGFTQAGIHVVAALDNDPDSAFTFQHNISNTTFLNTDICKAETDIIRDMVDKCQDGVLLFSGCAPCQPFSKQRTDKQLEDKRVPLLLEFLRFIEAYHPDYVFVENVPGLQKCRNTAGPFDTLLEKLTQLEYHYHTDILASQDYGVPQYRRRLVLLASRLGPVDFPAKTHGPGRTEGYATVRQWIHDLPALAAGESHPKVANHRAALLSPRNLERIRATPPGGGRLDWPEHLWLGCHAKHSGHTDVYGRMHWDQPATGLTTRCISLSNGRFGHPEQNRAISVREAACIQTFPRDFVFYGNLASMARQIGNAVPVLLARRFGQTIQQHYRQYNKPYGPI